ncbi:DegT/DnrJ/EryC1/StrS family aminotransferase [Ruminococcaceae bacterium OttesenSCG-928-L11]|nr:DegT/DnrJ/EryC1/StrS family aminotransferase [Ruminococcaceae bacterium OttesenSCG-928-L11]
MNATGQTPLLAALEAYIHSNVSRQHMPGHKGRLPWPLDTAAVYDLTEVTGTDSLYEADGAIAEMERQYTALYGSAASFLSAGGSTLCIQAMLALATQPGQRILCARGVHTATVNAMALLDLDPVWIVPEAGGDGLLSQLSPAAVDEALSADAAIRAVYVTSPTYFGVISDIGGLAQVCHSHGVPLLVDNAHGSHLKFLPEAYGIAHPMEQGADLCADSLHKTLPVLTGGALLHVGNPRFVPDAKRKLALFGSTSPSYLIMLSCDMALAYCREQLPGELARVCGGYDRLRQLAAARGIPMPEGLCDPLRLTLDFSAVGYTGPEFGEYLRANGIEPEYRSDSHCVFLGSPHTGEADFAAMERMLTELPLKEPLPRPAAAIPVPRRQCSVREAVFSTAERVSVENSVGRTASSLVCPCPPGIPLVIPGEGISDDIASSLKSYGIFHINVVK